MKRILLTLLITSSLGLVRAEWTCTNTSTQKHFSSWQECLDQCNECYNRQTGCLVEKVAQEEIRYERTGETDQGEPIYERVKETV